MEHRAIQPPIAFALPESRLSNSLPHFPVPVVIAPKCTRFVTARGDEFQILAIRNFVLIDGKCWDIHRMGFELVIPPELAALAQEAECNLTCRNFDAALNDRGNNGLRDFRLRNFLSER